MKARQFLGYFGKCSRGHLWGGEEEEEEEEEDEDENVSIHFTEHNSSEIAMLLAQWGHGLAFKEMLAFYVLLLLGFLPMLLLFL